MKSKIIAATLLGAMFALPVSAAVTPVCLGTAAGGKKDVAAGVSGTDFIIRSFAQACSKNVFMDFDQTSTTAHVAAVSKKGATVFGGTTEGGGGANCLKKLDSAAQKNITGVDAAELTAAGKAEFCK